MIFIIPHLGHKKNSRHRPSFFFYITHKMPYITKPRVSALLLLDFLYYSYSLDSGKSKQSVLDF